MQRVSFKVAKTLKQAGYPATTKPTRAYNSKGASEKQIDYPNELITKLNILTNILWK